MMRKALEPRYVKIFELWVSYSLVPLDFRKEEESEARLAM